MDKWIHSFTQVPHTAEDSAGTSAALNTTLPDTSWVKELDPTTDPELIPTVTWMHWKLF